MKRQEIMSECPEGHEDWLKDIIDHFEGKFQDIAEKLQIDDISKLDQISDAYDIAEKTATDLY